MSKIIKFLVVALVLFSASAGASWFLQQKTQKADDAKHAGGDGDHKGHGPVAATPVSHGSESPKASRNVLKPGQIPDAEHISKMAASLQQQTDQVRNREQQLTSRQKSLEVVFLDIRGEQKVVDDLRKQVGEEMRLLNERMEAAEKRVAEVRQFGQRVDAQSQELKSTQLAVDQTEEKRIKQMATVYDSMDPEAAAQTFQEMVESGKLDMAVKILASMRERQAARVLAGLQNHAVAVQILDRLKGLKTTSKTP